MIGAIEIETVRQRIVEKGFVEEMGRGRIYEGRSLKKEKQLSKVERKEKQRGKNKSDLFVGGDKACSGK